MLLLREFGFNLEKTYDIEKLLNDVYNHDVEQLLQ